MKTARFLPSQIWTIAQADAGNAVFIRPDGSDLVLPVYVSENDAQAILVELTRILAPRPMVHELMLSAIASLHGKLDRVEIYGIRSGTYLCRVVLVQDGREIRLESRPSDILCLSAKTGCPVQVDDEVLAKHGIPVDQVSSSGSSACAVQEPPSLASYLRKELDAALEKEAYERAALLRDQLAGIEKPAARKA